MTPTTHLPRAAPAALAERSRVLIEAYDEYCRLLADETPPDLDSFCRRWPAWQHSVRRALELVHLIDDVRRAREEPPWPRPGDSFLRLELRRELGRGAFARVFLAEEPDLGGRPVVVKVSPHGGAEAHTLGRLGHRNVVPVYGVGRDAATGLTAVIMPYLGAATLGDVLDLVAASAAPPRRADVVLRAARAAAVPGVAVTAEHDEPDAPLRHGSYVEGVLHLGAQLAEALACVHGLGVFHLDLKPSNVLLTPAGRPKLLDFNLASDRARGRGPVGGTPPYMAPEQLRAMDAPSVPKQGRNEAGETVNEPHGPRPAGRPPHAADGREDLFALGTILYELLTGKPPFGPVPEAPCWASLRDVLLERQARGPAPLRRANPQVDAASARLVERCLAFDPAARPATAAEVARELRRALSWRKKIARRPLAAVTAVLLALAAVAVVAAPLWPSRPPSASHLVDAALEAHRAKDFRQAVRLSNDALDAEPDSVRALLVRGRAFQELGNLTSALEDYRLANERAPDGRVWACMGHVVNLADGEHLGAVYYYERAVAAGFESAEVYNNLAYSQSRAGRSAEALASLGRALHFNPRLRAAYHNRALVHLHRFNGWALRAADRALDQDGRRAAEEQALCCQAAMLAALDEALGLGEPGIHLCHDAAIVRASAVARDPSQAGPALEMAERCAERGFNPTVIPGNLISARLKDHPRLSELKGKPSRLSSPPWPTGRFLDPVPQVLP